MSDLSESPEVEVDDAALDTPDEKLNAVLAPEEERVLEEEEEDASLLDAGLGETPAEDAEGNAGALLEESNDSVNVEDPVRFSLGVKCVLNNAPLTWCRVVHCPAAIQEIEAIKARVKEMEEEAEKLKEMQTEVEKQMSTKAGKRETERDGFKH